MRTVHHEFLTQQYYSNLVELYMTIVLYMGYLKYEDDYCAIQGISGLTMAASSVGRVWKRLKKSCRVEPSRNTDRHEVGICTVARSSADSSVEVPMKSKERHAQESLSSQLIRLR